MYFLRLLRLGALVSSIGTTVFFAENSTSAAGSPALESDCPRLNFDSDNYANALAKNTLAQKNNVALFRAMSQLWLNEDIAAANATIRDTYRDLLDGTEVLTPEIADEKFKWQMRLWVRIYGMFNQRDGWFAGRLEPETEAVFHELFWKYAFAKSTIDRADEQYTWFIQGSENHDLMDLSNSFLALEALSKLPDYAEKKLRDDQTVVEHAKAWNAHYRRYADSRVANGLLIECASSIYGKYSIPELVNMADFADDAVTRKKMTMLLDVLWADWASEQIDGLRGGGKSRVYQGKYSRFGSNDSYLRMSEVLLGLGNWTHGKHGHTNSGYVYCLAMGRYRLPSVVANIATSRPALPYASSSRRPSKMTGVEKLPDYQPHPCWYVLDPEDTRAVRYTYCTTDYVMGSWWVDPRLGESCIVKDGDYEYGNTRYAAIHAQNRWQGITISGDLNARIYPQCSSKRADKNDPSLSVTNHQHIAVQHQNVMIVQANLKRQNLEASRVYFAPSTRENLFVHGGWLVTRVGDTFAAVAGLGKTAKFQHGEWSFENYFGFDDMRASIIMVAADREQFVDRSSFTEYLDSFDISSDEKILTVQFQDINDQSAVLRFDTSQKKLPMVNGEIIALNPKRVYDNPLMHSEFGSGVVTIGDGQQAYVWDMQDNSIREIEP